MKKKTCVMALAFLLFFLPLLSGCIEENEAEDFEFMTIDGEKKYLSDYRGKIVILDMWATWCGPCQLQMAELKKVYDTYSRNDLEILSIDVDLGESVQQVKNFKAWFVANYDIELSWIFGMDDGRVWEKYKMSEPGGIPTLYIFDKKGNHQFSSEGVSAFSELTSEITNLL